VEGSVRESGSQVDWLARGRVPTKAVKRAVAVYEIESSFAGDSVI
jgi:hypothetical protein